MFLSGIDSERGAHLSRELQTICIHVGDDDITRARVAHDGSGHDADGTRAGDQNVFAQNRK